MQLNGNRDKKDNKKPAEAGWNLAGWFLYHAIGPKGYNYHKHCDHVTENKTIYFIHFEPLKKARNAGLWFN